MDTAVAERDMAKTSASKGERKTLKCSLETYQAVRRVANLRGIDISDYVDEVLFPIAEKDLQAEAKKIIRGDKTDR